VQPGNAEHFPIKLRYTRRQRNNFAIGWREGVDDDADSLPQFITACMLTVLRKANLVFAELFGVC
jgi:hypothetical protein